MNRTIGPDKHGIKTTINYYYNDKNQHIRQVQKFYVREKKVRLTNGMKERRELNKFGLENKSQDETNMNKYQICAKNAGVPQEYGTHYMGEVKMTSKSEWEPELDSEPELTDAEVDKIWNNLLKEVRKENIKKDKEFIEDHKNFKKKYWKKPKTNVTISKNKTLHNKETHTVIVSGLPTNIHEIDLYEVFSKCGKISHIFLCNSRYSRFKCAFIKFFDVESAKKSVISFNNYKIGHLTLDVNFV